MDIPSFSWSDGVHEFEETVRDSGSVTPDHYSFDILNLFAYLLIAFYHALYSLNRRMEVQKSGLYIRLQNRKILPLCKRFTKCNGAITGQTVHTKIVLHAKIIPKYEDMEGVNGAADVGVGNGVVGGTESLCG